MGYAEVKKWRAFTKRRLVVGFGSKCGICQQVDDDCIYDFHHLDPSKKDFTITSKITAWITVVREASKCVMLCCLCHRKLHKGLVVLPDGIQRFDENLIPVQIFMNGKETINECPSCGGRKSVFRKYCSRACTGAANFGSAENLKPANRKGRRRTWSVGSRKGIKMPRAWSRQPKQKETLL